MATINLLGIQKDIDILQGDTIDISFELFGVDGSPLDMTDYTIVSQLRYQDGKLAITCNLANQYMRWTNQSTGKFKLVIPAFETANLKFNKDDSENLSLKYDVECNSNSEFPGVFKPYYGTINLVREQTRVA